MCAVCVLFVVVVGGGYYIIIGGVVIFFHFFASACNVHMAKHNRLRAYPVTHHATDYIAVQI